MTAFPLNAKYINEPLLWRAGLSNRRTAALGRAADPAKVLSFF